jgi:membrane fusion protein, heavy metal efflux system
MNLRNMTTRISRKHLIAVALIIVVGGVAGGFILHSGQSSSDGQAHAEAEGHEDAEHHAAKTDKAHVDDAAHGDAEHHAKASNLGAHGGTLLTDGTASAEIQLDESGGEPVMRLWLLDKGKPIAPATVKAHLTLTRPTGEVERMEFVVDKDSLKTRGTIAEPHVFNAVVVVETVSQTSHFILTREEGKVELSTEQIKAAGIEIDKAGPTRIRSSLQLPGEIRFNEDRTAHVVPRVAGVVEAVSANLGQIVKKGQVLAVLASPALSEQRSELMAAQKRLSLAKTTYEREKKLWEEKISAEQDYLQARQVLREAEIALANAQQKLTAIGASVDTDSGLNRYLLRAPFDGMVVEKHIALGEAVKEDGQVFTISDLSTVWAEISVPAKDLARVRVGEKVTIKASSFDSTATGTVAYVGALIGEQTRTARARVLLSNPQGSWRPGLFVNVEVISNETEVPVTVLSEAIQSMDGKNVVFVRVGDGFVTQPVQTGRSDGSRTEIMSGLKTGMPYAAAGSFVLKAEIGKGSAEHEH